MHRISATITTLVWAGLLIPFQSVSAQNLSYQVSEILRSRITVSARPQKFLCRKKLLCGPNALLRFYADRLFRPVWSTNGGPLPSAAILVKHIHEADKEGLRPEDYHLVNIEALLAKIHHFIEIKVPPEPEMVADLDLLLTDAFLLYGSHLLAGRVNPETIQSEWVIKSRDADLVRFLHTARDANDINKILGNLAPQHTGYVTLKQALLSYRNIMKKGGWPLVPSERKMKKGDWGPHASALRSRLIASADLVRSKERDQDIFDEVLDQAVRKFQKRHGLRVDGVVGRATLNELNVPVEQRVRQIKSNLERWRWLPPDLGPRHVLVNIANFQLDVIENNHVAITMRVVVGKDYRRTPVFTGKMTYLELNPYWHIPPKIAREDILPRIQKDPEYLKAQKIRVFENWKEGAPEVAPESVDWSQLAANNLSFKFLQVPGPSNPLGRVKFIFPNKFSVYLHDTPTPELFNHTKPTFSSGCIRVERPIDLTEYLLKDDPKWSREDIVSSMGSGKTQFVMIPRPITVHILYWTTWDDEDGRILFRDDIYRRDTLLYEALIGRPPAP
jgi:murein L,D-transpeptidase YcbB/YkuD